MSIIPKYMRELDLDRPIILAALESIKSGENESTQQNPSKTTYILCPDSKTLWDIKVVTGMALNTAGYKGGFGTGDARCLVKVLGFDVIKFKDCEERNLGIRGFDIDALNDSHIVYYSDGREVENGFAPEIIEVIDKNGKKTERLVSRYVRNSALVKQIKDAAKGVCDACKIRPFKTPSGDWFLEVHHKKWLSDGGLDELENMVALCPNCHRQEHHGKKRRYN